MSDLYSLMNWPDIEGIEYVDLDHPADILGQHVVEQGLLIQVFEPGADKVIVSYGKQETEMERMDDSGFFALLIDSKQKISYKLKVVYGEHVVEKQDAYAFSPELPISAIKRQNAGIGYDAYKYMGARMATRDGVDGVTFTVWAPFALRVSVVGDFNNWDGRRHQMSRVGDTGMYSIFVPGVQAGALYKYEIKKKGGEQYLKADPYALAAEAYPNDASIVCDVLEAAKAFPWTDKDYLAKREGSNCASMPVNIYEVNLENYLGEDGFDFEKTAKIIGDYAKKMNYTHVEIVSFAKTLSGNPFLYDISDFYAMDPKFGDYAGLLKFVDYLHSQNIGVIFDYSVFQFASAKGGMCAYDGSNLFEHMDPKKGVNPRNGAFMFNYARPEVTSFLLSNAFMWLNEFHADGLKFAKAAGMLYLDYDRKPGEWVTNIYGSNENLEAIEFIKHFNSIIHKSNPGVITIAEDNSGYPNMTGKVDEDCLGFDFKWNESWRKDLLSYMSVPPYLRGSHYNELSMSMIYQYTSEFVLGFPSIEFVDGGASLLGKMAGDNDDFKFANYRLALAYAMVHPGKKMMFMGEDTATYESYTKKLIPGQNLVSEERGKQIQEFVKKLNELYVNQPALYEQDNVNDGFEWINNISARESILTFARKGNNYGEINAKEEDMLVVICNFDAVDRTDYKVGVPRPGKYKEVFTTAKTEFGGNGFVNARAKVSKKDECDGREDSIRVNVPGLGITVLKYSKVEDKETISKEESKTGTAKKSTTKKSAATKTAATKGTTTKTAATKASATKSTSAKKKETVKVEEPKKEAVKAEEPKKEAVKAEEPKKEAAKAEEPKKEAVKAEEPKKEAVKVEEPKKEAVKAEEPKKEAAKVEEPKKEAVKAEEPKKEAAKKTVAKKSSK